MNIWGSFYNKNIFVLDLECLSSSFLIIKNLENQNKFQ